MNLRLIPKLFLCHTFAQIFCHYTAGILKKDSEETLAREIKKLSFILPLLGEAQTENWFNGWSIIAKASSRELNAALNNRTKFFSSDFQISILEETVVESFCRNGFDGRVNSDSIINKKSICYPIYNFLKHGNIEKTNWDLSYSFASDSFAACAREGIKMGCVANYGQVFCTATSYISMKVILINERNLKTSVESFIDFVLPSSEETPNLKFTELHSNNSINPYLLEERSIKECEYVEPEEVMIPIDDMYSYYNNISSAQCIPYEL